MADDYIGEIKQERFKNTKDLSRFLTKELAKNGYVNIVEDELLKDVCFKSAFSGYCLTPVSNDVFKPIIAEGKSESSMEDALLNATTHLKAKAADAGANYVFTKTAMSNGIRIHSKYHSGWSPKSDAYETMSDEVFSVSILATPYSIIGKKELETLKTVYASGAPYEVSVAVKKYFDTSIEHDFADLYTNNPREFRSMFAMQGPEKRIETIKKIQRIEKRNPDNDQWLSSKYAKEVEASLVGSVDGNEEGA